APRSGAPVPYPARFRSETPRALAASLAERRDLLCSGLEAAGFRVTRPAGTYFVMADAADLLPRLCLRDGVELCRALPELAGVVRSEEHTSELQSRENLV